MAGRPFQPLVRSNRRRPITTAPAHVLPALTRQAGDSARRDVRDLHVLCLGAGGAATALLLALHLNTYPERITADLLARFARAAAPYRPVS